MLIHFLPLLEGEPDAGTISDAPEEPGQPQEPEPASDQPEGASDEPAPEGEETPAEEAEQPADELTDDDWQALREKYPDRFPQPKEEPKPERAKEQDRYFEAVSQQATDSWARLTAGTQKIASGELPDDPDAFLADMAANAAWHAASERRGHIAVNRAVMEREIGFKADSDDPLHQQYGELLTELEGGQQNAFRLRQQAVREYDPKKRGELLQKADIMDANAVGNFYAKSLAIAVEHGKTAGKMEAEKDAGKRITKTVDQAKSNVSREAIAKAAAAVRAKQATASASTPTEVTHGPLTLEEAQTLPPSELKARLGKQ